MFKLIGMLLGGGAIPREAARARSNNGCLPVLLVFLVSILICVALMACGILEVKIEFDR
jgi:hypothetical protein